MIVYFAIIDYKSTVNLENCTEQQFSIIIYYFQI